MGKQSVDNTSIMKVLFAINLVLLPMLAMGQEEERLINTTNISEKHTCYVPGQCQEYSVNFKRTDDVDLCHKFCGTTEDCSWWSFEPSQNLCVLFANCTESGAPDTVACEACISGERLCPPRECHKAIKCEGIFIDSFEIEHLEDCIKACSDISECLWFTLEKTHNHCILYEDCVETKPCDTCASGERECSVGYHGPTEAPTTAPTTAPTAAPTTALTTTPPDQGYTSLTNGNVCKRISTRADCETAAGFLGLSKTTATTNDVSYRPPYCYYMPGKNQLYFNTAFTSTTSCSNDRH